MTASDLKEGYVIFKKALQQDLIYKLHDIQSKDQKQIWLLKIFDLQVATRNSLDECIFYNQAVLWQLRDKLQNIIYIKEVFQAQDKIYFVQEKFSIRLDQYARGGLSSAQATTIIQQIFNIICDLFQNDYHHRSIRPQHFVLVEDKWKLQTLVLTAEYKAQSLYSWKESFSSPLQIKQKSHFDEGRHDREIIYQFGILAAYLLLGNSVPQSISWKEVRRKAERTPIAELIEKGTEHKIGLEQFVNLQVFKECDRKDLMEFLFATANISKRKQASKIIGDLRKSKQSLRLTNTLVVMGDKDAKNRNLMQHSNNEIKEKLDQMYEKCKFMQMYDQYANRFKYQDFRVFFLHFEMNYATQLKMLLQKTNKNSNRWGKKQQFEEYQMQLKRRKMKNNFSLSKEELLKKFNKIAGIEYMRIKRIIDTSWNEKQEITTEYEQIIRSLCYLVVASGVNNIQTTKTIYDSLSNIEGKSLSQYIQRQKISTIVLETQDLLKRFFKIVEETKN